MCEAIKWRNACQEWRKNMITASTISPSMALSKHKKRYNAGTETPLSEKFIIIDEWKVCVHYCAVTWTEFDL